MQNQSNIRTYIKKGFDGGRIVSNIIGSVDDPQRRQIYIPKSCVSMCISAHPYKIAEFIKANSVDDDGLASRMVFNIIGNFLNEPKEGEAFERKVSKATDLYNENFKKLINFLKKMEPVLAVPTAEDLNYAETYYNTENIQVDVNIEENKTKMLNEKAKYIAKCSNRKIKVSFSLEAKKLQKDFFKSMITTINELDDNSFLRAYLSRTKSYFLRIAAVMQLWEDVAESDKEFIKENFIISERTAACALEITAYYTKTFKKLLKKTDKYISKALKLLKFFKENNMKIITESQLYMRLIGGLFNSWEELHETYKLLEQHNYISREIPDKKTRGRPATHIKVNPQLFN